MDDLWKELHKPLYWLTVLIGVVGGVAANYWQRWIDRFTKGWSERSAQRAQRQDAQFSRHVDELIANPHLVPFVVAEETRLRWSTFGQLVYGLGILGLAIIDIMYGHKSGFALIVPGLWGLVGAIGLSLAITYTRRANYIGHTLRTVYRTNRSKAGRPPGDELIV